MGGTTRCSVCGRYAKVDLGKGNLCTPCHTAEEEYRYVGDDYPGFGSDREFLPSKFGIIKDKFGYEK